MLKSFILATKQLISNMVHDDLSGKRQKKDMIAFIESYNLMFEVMSKTIIHIHPNRIRW